MNPHCRLNSPRNGVGDRTCRLMSRRSGGAWTGSRWTNPGRINRQNSIFQSIRVKQTGNGMYHVRIVGTQKPAVSENRGQKGTYNSLPMVPPQEQEDTERFGDAYGSRRKGSSGVRYKLSKLNLPEHSRLYPPPSSHMTLIDSTFLYDSWPEDTSRALLPSTSLS
jgi:hypothetical protein